MIKYYKTPDVITTDSDGNSYCSNGVIILDTSKMDEESNETALRLINKLGFVKCSKVESESRLVLTPLGSLEYLITKVINQPKIVREISYGLYIVDGKTIDTTADLEILNEQLYGDKIFNVFKNNL